MLLKLLLYRLKRPYHWFKTGLLRGFTSQLKYRFPEKRLKIIAITGTDGKTTSSTMLYTVLKQSGKKVALLSTVAAYVGDEAIDTGFHVTTPDPRALYKFMRRLVDEGYEYLVMETTSHGIYQYRTWGIKPLIAGITNVSHEHLDYHVTYQEYLSTKAELLTNAQLAVVNDDDQSAFSLKTILRLNKIPMVLYGQEHVPPKKVMTAINKRFKENYNRMNAQLVYQIAQKLTITDQDFMTGIAKFAGIPGRMEVVATKPFTVLVDFAHTPQGLEAALTTLRAQLNSRSKPGKLIAVYGSAGLRDRAKRPMMGQIGVDLADRVVFTAEDPRTENIWSIIRQMKEQLTTGHNKIASVADRGEAIEFALERLAKPGDIVGIFGKGHEQSMCYGKTEYPWDDRQAVRILMDKLYPAVPANRKKNRS